MIRYLLALLLCLPSVALATDYNAVLNNRSTSFTGVDGLCSKTRTTGACVPFMSIDANQITARAIDEKSGETVSILDYCKKSQTNGTIDNTVCIQAAVNDRCANGGGTIHFPAGRYAIGDASNPNIITISCPGVHIKGDGFGDLNVDANRATFIRVFGSGTNPVFRFVGTPNTSVAFIWQAGGSVENLTMFQNPGNRSGPFIEFDKLQQTRVSNVYMWAPCTAIKHDGGFMGLVENVIAESLNSNCNVMVLNGSSAVGTTLDVVRYQNVKVNAGTGSVCFKVTDRVQTAWWVNTICQTSGKSLEVSCPTMSSIGNCPGFFTLYDFETESFNTASSQIDVTDMVNGLKITDSWFRGFSTGSVVAHNISIVPSRFPASQQGLPITIANNWFKHAGGSCLYIQSERVSYAGNHIYGCGKLADGPGYAAIEVRANYATITGNTLGGSDFLNDASGFPNGVVVISGVNYVSVTGNVIGGGVTTGVVNNGGTAFSNVGNVGP